MPRPRAARGLRLERHFKTKQTKLFSRCYFTNINRPLVADVRNVFFQVSEAFGMSLF